MADQPGHELAQTWGGLGTHRVDDIVSEVGVETVRRHGYFISSCSLIIENDAEVYSGNSEVQLTGLII